MLGHAFYWAQGLTNGSRERVICILLALETVDPVLPLIARCHSVPRSGSKWVCVHSCPASLRPNAEPSVAAGRKFKGTIGATAPLWLAGLWATASTGAKCSFSILGASRLQRQTSKRSYGGLRSSPTMACRSTGKTSGTCQSFSRPLQSRHAH